MNATADTLADAILSCDALVSRYLVGFDATNATRQAPGLPNHAVWVLGHLALYQHRAAERLSGTSMELGWDPEPVAFDSVPVEDPARYPTLPEAAAYFRDSLTRLAGAVRSLDDHGLNKEVAWGSSRLSARNLVARMIFHAGTHTGQLLDLRRALELPRVL